MRLQLERLTDVVVIITSVTVLGVGVQLYRTRSGGPKSEPVQKLEDGTLLLSTSGSANSGSLNARLALFEFSDFECPFCGRHAREVYPQIRDNFVKTGKVRYIFKNLPLRNHRLAKAAANGAECAGDQGRFWEMHNQLFANQQTLGEDYLLAHAESIGIDQSQFRACMSGRGKGTIDRDLKDAERLKVTGTPTFLIGVVQDDGQVKLLRRINGAQQYSQFVTVFEDLLKTHRTTRRSSIDNLVAQGILTGAGPERSLSR